MKCDVIHIFGASGSGVSTLGEKLSLMGYRQLDVDDYYWIPTDPPFTTKRPIPERLKKIEEDIIRYGKVVITGSLCGWGDPLLPYFDIVIRTNLDSQERIKRIKAREESRYGERIKPHGDLYQSSREFVDWAAQYETGDASMRSKQRHDEWQERITCPVFVVDTLDTDKALLTIKSLIKKQKGRGEDEGSRN